MPTRLSLFLAIVLLWVTGVSDAQAQELDGRITSVFLFNFAKQIQWPAQVETGDFVIGVLGNSPVADELKSIANHMKIRGRSVVIKQFGSPDQISELKTCHILFVNRKESKFIKSLAGTLGSESILIVAEGEGQRGSAINVFLDEEASRPKFELSKTTMEKIGLKATSSLLSLAVLM
jgi:hypothetical protein